MVIVGDGVSLCFRSFGRAELTRVLSLQLERFDRFLEPLDEIVAAVRAGVSHRLVGIEADGALAGFYVVHPDRRDRACWWLGWLAIDVRWQGAGMGRAGLRSALARMRGIAGCRRIRLLVAAENAVAVRLYRAAGFRMVGLWAATGEWVMERAEAGGVPAQERLDLVANAYAMLQAMWLRLWRRGAPPAAKLSGEFHGPPAASMFGARLSGSGAFTGGL